MDDQDVVFADVSLGYRTGMFGTRSIVVLSSLNFKVSATCPGVLTGANGSGKTTILRAAGGLLQPQSGRITLAGGNPCDRRIAYLPQVASVLPWHRAIDEVSLLLEIAGVSRTARLAQAEEVMQRFGFDAAIYSKNHQLSGGQKQMVAVARCLVAAEVVDLVLLDEPTNFMDREVREQFLAEFQAFVKDIRCPMLIATHDQGLADMLSPYRLEVRDGSLCTAGRHEHT